MLLRMGHGKRDYHTRPSRVLTRQRWEFIAVLEGRIAMVLPSGPDILKEHTLWLSRPTHTHGWIGEKGRPAQIVAFQFSYIPAALAKLLPEGEATWEFSISPHQRRCLRDLGQEAERFWHQPRAGRMLCFEHILTELSLMVFEFLSAPDPSDSPDIPFRRVNRAVEWYTRHLAENPGIAGVSQAIGVSPAQLRRDFHFWLNASPVEVFSEIRMNHAISLMGETGINLEEIAGRCGYQSASAFSTAFKQKFGKSPHIWRSENDEKRRLREGR